MTRPATPEEWPAIFAEGWLLSKPDGFVDFFLPLIAPDAVFTQPLVPKAVGHDQVRTMFRRLFAAFPDFLVTPHDADIDGDVVAIRSRCTVTVGRNEIAFPVTDTLTIQNGLIARRVATFSLGPLTRAVLWNPGAVPRIVRANLRRS
jgi:hypothetical protein